MAGRTKWTIEEENFLINNYGKISSIKISAQLNKSPQAIASKRLKLKIPVILEKYKRNNSFFINHKNRHYWAGFIAADGCINPINASPALQLMLAPKDLQHLEEFKHDIEYSGPILRFKNRDSIMLRIVSKEICEDLSNIYNIKPHDKSFTLQPPKIKKQKEIFEFICGFIDGDGCIYIDNRRRLGLNIICGSLDFLKWIKTQLDKIYTPPKANIRQKKNIFSYTIIGKGAEKIVNKLLQLNTPALTRKWSKINELTLEKMAS